MSTGLLLLAVAGCAPAAIDQAPTTASTPAAAAPLDVPAGAPLAEFFQKYDEAQLSLSPQTKAYRGIRDGDYGKWRSEEHTSELQSLMRISYAVFCLKKKNKSKTHQIRYRTYDTKLIH